MRPGDVNSAVMLSQQLDRFSQVGRELPGIVDAAVKAVLIEQILESIRRVRYVFVIRTRHISPLRISTNSDLFDPLKGAIHFQRLGNFDEACWMVFLFVHFGRNMKGGWRLARDVYGRLGEAERWSWTLVSADPTSFRDWLSDNQETLRGADGVARGFGNHRKYQSLDAHSTTGTGAAVETYVNWVRDGDGHGELFLQAQRESGEEPRLSFEHLYQSMNAVASFGRTARFDYLTMIGKIQLANIEPGSTYMEGATGPLAGGRLLFGNDHLRRREVDDRLVHLDRYLNVGMQVLEDSLCNWQKRPNVFKPFRG